MATSYCYPVVPMAGSRTRGKQMYEASIQGASITERKHPRGECRVSPLRAFHGSCGRTTAPRKIDALLLENIAG